MHRSTLVRLAAAGLVALTLPRAGLATTGLEWKWDAPIRFHLIGQFALAKPLPFNKIANVDVRVAEFTAGATVLCRAEDQVGARGWDVKCDFEDVMLVAATVRSDAGRLPEILEEMEQEYYKSHIRMLLTSDGKLREFDLDGLEQRYSRINRIQENMRLIMARLFAAFDSNLPKKGDDKGREWKQDTFQQMGFPSNVGSTGSAMVHHKVEGVEGTVARIRTSGRGTLGPNVTVDRGGGEEVIADLYDMSFEGLATFDLAAGHMVEVQYQVIGEPTASSLSSQGAAGITYTQAVRMVHVPEGTPPPTLGPNKEAELTRNIY